MGLFFKQKKDEQRTGFNVSNLIVSLAIVVLFIAIGLLILGFRGIVPFNTGTLLAIFTLFIVSGAALLAMPWVRRLQNGRYKIVSWVYLGLLILCAIFWLIVTFLLVKNFHKLGEDAAWVIRIINFTKFTLIYTMNYSIASLIATNIIKYGKRMIPFQVILYASNLFVDLYFTFLFCCIHFNSDSFVSVDWGKIQLLRNPIVTTIFLIAFVYMIVANAIAIRIERRRLRYAGNDDDTSNEAFDGQKQQKPAERTTQEKLAELKSMLDQNLISQEEYDQKKNDLLSKM